MGVPLDVDPGRRDPRSPFYVPTEHERREQREQDYQDYVAEREREAMEREQRERELRERLEREEPGYLHSDRIIRFLEREEQ